MKSINQLGTFFLALFFSISLAQSAELDLKFAGALEFSDKGTLFVGDNHNGAIYAFEMDGGSAPAEVKAVLVGDIDIHISSLLGVGPRAVDIHDMAVHPITKEIYISASRITPLGSKPAIVKVLQNGTIELLNLAAHNFTKQLLVDFPSKDTTFKPRGLMKLPPTSRDIAKGDLKLTSVAIMDMVFHKGELFVSGVAFDNFLSSIRRITYPFNGDQGVTAVKVYHISHSQYETRAPVRAMAIEEIDGKEQLVAAYTCSPIALIPLDELVHGAKITAKTIGNIGAGQPIDMVPLMMKGKRTLFVSNNSRSPQIIPVAGLNGARVVTDLDYKAGADLADANLTAPFGPMGTMEMFEGSSIRIDLLSEKYLVSLTRDAKTGSLNLDSNFSFFPSRLHNLIAEFDFPQYYEEKKAKETSE